MSGGGIPATRPTRFVGADGLTRCGWTAGADTYLVDYHDKEWGRPIHSDAALFRALVLTYFENGLSWAVVFHKRDALDRAFADFAAVTVAAFGDRDVERLMHDPTIIRNRAKIEATVHNARILTSISLDEIVWSYRPERRHSPRTWGDGRAQSPESRALAEELRRLGFRLVGPMVAHSFMQAAGIDNGHFDGCFRAPPDRASSPSA